MNEFLKEMNELTDRAYANVADIRERVAKIVTTYQPKE